MIAVLTFNNPAEKNRKYFLEKWRAYKVQNKTNIKTPKKLQTFNE